MDTGCTFEGWGARLRPQGCGRSFSAAFLALWLRGWLLGEVSVIMMLCGVAWSLLTGQPTLGDAQELHLGPTLATGAFLVVWLSFWTVGGILAGREFLRLLWSQDRIIVGPHELRIERTTGPFKRIRSLPRPSCIIAICCLNTAP